MNPEVERRPEVWVRALRSSHERLARHVAGLDRAGREGPSFDREWSVAQVCSHLGSQAEIHLANLDAALAGNEPPGRDDYPAFWERWDAKRPEEQVADSLTANEALIGRLEALAPAGLAALTLRVGGREVDGAGFVQSRVVEHVLHTWDVVVAGELAAPVDASAVALLVDTLPARAGRLGRGAGQRRLRLLIACREPERRFDLLVDGEARLACADGPATEGLTRLELPAEVLLRLFYGRLTPRDAVFIHLEPEGLALDELVACFPGP